MYAFGVVSIVVNFLAELAKELVGEGKLAKTVEGYRSTISTVWESCDLLKIGDDPRVKRLFKGIQEQLPREMKGFLKCV